MLYKSVTLFRSHILISFQMSDKTRTRIVTNKEANPSAIVAGEQTDGVILQFTSKFDETFQSIDIRLLSVPPNVASSCNLLSGWPTYNSEAAISKIP